MAKLTGREFQDRYGEWALVAGAAEGIGEGFSEALAKKGMNLVMVDINSSVLHALAERIMKTYHIMTIEMTMDLSGKDAWMTCMEALQDMDCRLLIYIPAYSRVKTFLSNSSDELDKYIDLNTRTPIHLVHSFISAMKEQKTAGIVLMSSLAGLIGTPYIAPYSATKAFNILLAESLRSEIRSKRFDLSVCCAGQSSTPAYWSSKPSSSVKWPPVMDPVQVADYTLKKLGKKTIIIPGGETGSLISF